MEITITPFSVAVTITMIGLLIAVACAALDEREMGQYTLPIRSLIAFPAWIISSLVAWTMWLLS